MLFVRCGHAQWALVKGFFNIFPIQYFIAALATYIIPEHLLQTYIADEFLNGHRESCGGSPRTGSFNKCDKWSMATGPR
jgi:hypothetical protein